MNDIQYNMLIISDSKWIQDEENGWLQRDNTWNHEEIESIYSINGLVDFIQTIMIWIHSSIG